MLFGSSAGPVPFIQIELTARHTPAFRYGLQGGYIMNSRLQLQKLGAGTAGAVMLWAVAVTQSSVAAAGPVTISSVQGAFYPNPNNIGAFDPAVLTSPAAFTQQFPVIAFNPPIGAVSCSNITSADVN